jgi:CheY-like chemotaxis protein
MSQESTAANGGTVVVQIRDLFFSVKVKNELEAAGYDAVIVKREPELLSSVESLKPVLVLIDLGSRPNWEALAPILGDARPDDAPPVVAFGPHKDIESRRTAQAHGVTRVVTNQQLHRNLVGYVQQYARVD